jgi:hypothetical protein
VERLPEVKTLYELLPKGVEGGKEFARIVDLLLFHEARRGGKKITIFNDAAGDYRGLDSFNGDSFRKEGTTGYQYKFYPSPLSNDHRKNIIDSLKHVAENQKKIKLKKWILVTPQDFMETANRTDGGDITWFENLRKELKLNFELEHWGHRNLLALFLQTPFLCLFYYPGLTNDGAVRKKTIEDTRTRYNENLIKLYDEIQFVGMSIYKQEASRGIPMEHIYIPLTVVPEAADERDSNLERLNPLTFLTTGARHVILGDPGSGKSTLMRFLALTGISRALQERYQAQADSRLPVLVILRRYADELKTRPNLSLLDYIQESIQGQFSLKSADFGFLEYYLETGQTILLFDGLDELPNPQFKQIVRDRILALLTTYPGNTTLITSRIVGYDTPFRFDGKEFGHYRLTGLQLPEIEQFVNDWYEVRIENRQEREMNVQDLIRILRDENLVAIRELAENPLLLTIITLVHRIDAVLPDERVVLYQKCTETLLNTWHTWKFRETEVKNRGKVERRNRRRMEEIAYWMHCRSIGTGQSERAVVPFTDLHQFLTGYIAEYEKPNDPDNDPEDLAADFLEFIKKRAGLLIEIGDHQFSFVHLTFQEYLTSSRIITNNEKAGATGIWATIEVYCHDPRWHEVIRLLVAGLKSDETQRFLIDQILAQQTNGQYLKSQLLGGLMLDGIGPAEERTEEILEQLIYSGCKVDQDEQFRPIIAILRIWLAKDRTNEEILTSIYQNIWKGTPDHQQKLVLTLLLFSLNLPETKIIELTEKFLSIKGQKAELLKFFFIHSFTTEKFNSLKPIFELFFKTQNFLALRSAPLNFLAATGQAILFPLGFNVIIKRAFEQQIIALRKSIYGPLCDFIYNSIVIALDDRFSTYKWALDWDLTKTLSRGQARNQVLDRALVQPRSLDRELDLEPELKQNLKLFRDHGFDFFKPRDRALARAKKTKESFWQVTLATSDLYNPILDFLCGIFALTPQPQWREALRVCYLPTIPQRITLFDETWWKQTETAFAKGDINDIEIYSAAWQLLFDTWLYVFEYYQSPEESLFSRLADLTRTRTEPPLRIAHCIRDLAYGDESRTKDLVAMVKSEDPEYRAIFETCLWR